MMLHGISSAFDVGSTASFIVLLALAGACDVRIRRIPNSLVASLALLGVGYAVAELGGGAGMISALTGLVVGLVIWLPWYALGMIGAGDVKLFAAGSVWLGPRLALSAAAISAILGGALAVSWLLWLHLHSERAAEGVARANGDANDLVEVDTDTQSRGALPYGVAMAAGLGVIAWFPHVLR